MTKKHTIAFLLIMSFAGAALGGGTDNYPVSAGSTQPRSRGAVTLDGMFGNPALTGLDRHPRAGLTLLPTSAAIWSDKLAPPFNRDLLNLVNPLSDSDNSWASYLASFFEQSFGLDRDFTPEENSKILTRELRGGVGLYAGFQTAPFAFATRGGGFTLLKTYADIDINLPEGILLPVFSATDGIRAGETLDLSGLDIRALWATELIAIKLGAACRVPEILSGLGFDRGAAGLGVKVLAGHSYFEMKADKNASIKYDTTDNKYRASAKIDIMSVGTGIYGDFAFDRNLFYDSTLQFSKRITDMIRGGGLGIDAGYIFHGDNHFLSADIQDIGAIFWDKNKVYSGTSHFNHEFDLPDLAEKMSELFDLNPLERGTADNASSITWLPMALNLGYTYYQDLSRYSALDAFLGYVSMSAGVRQQIVLGPGKNTYMPRLAGGATLGLLSGFLPVRYGLVLGGPENLASVVGIGIDLKYVSADASLKAVGSPFLAIENGFEAAAAATVRWGWKKKERKAKAREEEPQQEPEPVPEPEPEPEPVVNPPLPEIKDFPKEEEVVYPPVEIVLTMLQPTVEEKAKLGASLRAVNFRSGGADLTPGSNAALDEITALLKQYPHIRYEIQGHTDSQGADMQNLLLSAERAAAVKQALLVRGLPEDNLIAIGYGKNAPIADNATAQGRALNRRVEFVQILSDEHYETLKKFETEMMKNITKRVFQGAR